MPDLATLGLEVRSDEVAASGAALDKLTGAAVRAEAAANGFVGAARGAEAAARGVSSAGASAAGTLAEEAAAATEAAASTEQLTRSTTGSAGAMRQMLAVMESIERDLTVLVNRLLEAGRGFESAGASATSAGARFSVAGRNVQAMGGSFSGLAAQLQDVGVTAAAGMSPLIIGLQQGTQIAGQMEASLQNGGTVAGVFGAALKSLLSPVSLLSVGLTVLLAAGLQLVNWGAVAKGALNGVADTLVTIAPYAALAAAGLALLYAPTIIGGLVSLVTSLGTVATAVWGIATAIYATVGLPVLLVAAFTAMVAAAVIWRDDLKKAFGFDIVQAAQDGLNAIIGFFVGGFNAIKDTWGLLPAAFKDIFILAMNNAIDVVQNGINGITGALRNIPGLGDKIGNVDLSGYKGQASGALGDIQGVIGKDFAAQQGKNFVGSVVSAIETGASAVADKLHQLAGGIDLTGESSKKLEEEWRHLTTGAEKQIDTLNLQASSYGMTAVAADTLRFHQGLLDQAANDNITLTTKQSEKLHELTNKYHDAALAAAGAALEFADQTPWQDMQQQLANLNELLDAGSIHWNTYAAEVGKAAETMVRSYAAGANDVIDNLGNLTDAMNLQGQEAFDVHKALSIARAVVSGGEAIVHSFNAGTAIGGPPVGFAFAAVAAAATAAQIAQIAASSYQSTSPVSANGGGGAATASVPAQPQQTQAVPSATLVFNGKGKMSREDAAEMIDALNAAFKDGYKLRVA